MQMLERAKGCARVIKCSSRACYFAPAIMTAPYTMRVVLPQHPNVRIEFVHADEAKAAENQCCRPHHKDTQEISTPKLNPKKCHRCPNQSAKACANACCGKCCAKWGPKPCEKHGTPEREDSDVVSIDSSCLDQEQPAEKRTKHGVMYRECQNQASQWCANVR